MAESICFGRRLEGLAFQALGFLLLGPVASTLYIHVQEYTIQPYTITHNTVMYSSTLYCHVQ